MRYVALLSCVLLPAALAAQETPKSPIAKGSMLVDGSAFLARFEGDDNDPGRTIATISPSVLFFAANRFAIGGDVTLGRSSVGDSKATFWSIGPAVRYYFAPLQSKTLPFIAGSFGMGRSSESNPTGDFDVSNAVLDGSVGVTWLLVPNVGLTGEAFAQRTTTWFDGGTLPVENTVTSFGLRFGVSAFVF